MTTFTTEDRIIAEKNGSVTINVEPIPFAGMVTLTEAVPKYKELTDDAIRYQWLRNEYAHGRETYLAEGIPSGEKLDAYIDEQIKKAQEK
jgi:hypothetical protein